MAATRLRARTPKFPFRKIVCAALAAAFAGSFPCGASANAGGSSFTALSHAFPGAVMRRGDQYLVRVGSQVLRLRATETVVRNGGQDVYHLSAAPRVIGGRLCLSQSDIDALLDLAGEPVHTAQFRTFEIPAARKPLNSAVQTGTRGKALFSGAERSPDRMMFRYALMDRSGRTREFSVDGTGKTVRGSLTMDGYGDANAWTYGLVAFGTQERYAQIGEQADDLAGVVYFPSRSVGVAYAEEDAGMRVFDTLRGTRRFIGYSRTQNARTFTFAAIRENRSFSGLVAGERVRYETPERSYVREAWIGMRGAAAGIAARTPGRFFFESAESLWIGDFPMQPGDAPLRENAGYHFSPALTVRAGAAKTYKVHGSDYFNVTLESSNVSLIATQSAADSSFGLTAHGNDGYAAVSFARAPGLREWHAEGAAMLGRGQIQFLGSSVNAQNSDATLEWRSTRSTAAMVFGLETVHQNGRSATGPLAGIALSLNRYLSVQIEKRPILNGSGLRVEIAQQIDLPARRSAPTAVHALDAGDSPIRYYVDGVQWGTQRSSGAKVRLPPGLHTLVVQSEDGASESLPLEVRGGQQSVEAPLYPMRRIEGRITVEDPADFAVPPELDLVTVELLPGTAFATTDATGRFVLPPAPVAPQSAIQVVADSLPDNLEPGKPARIGADGSVILYVRAKRRIERARF